MSKQHTLILTCAGKSERFSSYGGAKWSLTHPSGNIMAVEALRGIQSQLDSSWRIIVAVSADDLRDKGIEDHEVEREFTRSGYSVEVIQIEESTSRCDTLRQVYRSVNFGSGKVVVRDCDNHLAFDLNPGTAGIYVVVGHPEVWPCHELGERSYVEYDDEEESVTAVLDGVVDIPGPFCAGAYIFNGYRPLFKKLINGNGNMTDILQQAIANSWSVGTTWAWQYEDWGDEQKWRALKDRSRAYFVDIDGVLFRSAHRTWGELTQGRNLPLLANIQSLRRLKGRGAQIILTTSRAESLRSETMRQLDDHGVSYDQLVMGLPCSTGRVLVNDKVSTRREQTAQAVEMERNESNLSSLLHIDEL